VVPKASRLLVPLLAVVGGLSDVVDIFDGNAGTWHTAQLSVARYRLSATSLPSQGLALFAGGQGALFLTCFVLSVLRCVTDACVSNLAILKM
jgi:hypothetical protein